MLQRCGLFKDAPVVRTRDDAVISKAKVVVDVGGIYDPTTLRFDHHQRGFTETFDASHSIKLSSAGLVYKHFGREVIANLLDWPESDPRVEIIYQKVYDDFVEGFDGVDNGVSQFPSDLRPKYRDSTSISHRVARLNPWWNQESNDSILYDRFLQAVALTGSEFLDRVKYTALSWLPAREIVRNGIAERTKAHKSGKIVVFESFCPWKEHLHLLESPDEEKVLYVIYPDESGKWRVQAVPEAPDSFVSRKPLPEPWCGLRDAALDAETGIGGCIFVHISGFIGGNTSRAGALDMAIRAVEF
ncbi:hypothetical protein HDU83_004769 [Entophlyctis luteolus]|nr:hypothetical protein HDU83_004769 [Entophlyctis luteolus]